jgi:hypothetical protein
MGQLLLPSSTVVGKVVHKKMFDDYTNTTQRRKLTDMVSRIIWTHKLAPETLNLKAIDIPEIQVFRLELKTMGNVLHILDFINKAIPYPILFEVEYETSVFLAISIKHPHPLNENKTVIDWTFQTDWFLREDYRYQLKLKKSIDAVYRNICAQIYGDQSLEEKSIPHILEHCQAIASLQKEVERLRRDISACNQFNRKVGMNILLKEKESVLSNLERERRTPHPNQLPI